MKPDLPLLPVQTFGELFESAKKWGYAPGANTPKVRAGRMWLSSYLAHSGQGGRHLPALEIRPTAATVDAVQAHMLAIDNDQIYFEVIDHADGTSTVYAKYNKILGSRKLAEISTESIPEV